jgi:histidinol phosphatase-like enzyme
MLEQAVEELHLDLTRAYVIGDQKRDVMLARQVGAKAILVMTGKGGAEALRELEAESGRPDAVARSMGEAVEWIIADAQTLHTSRASTMLGTMSHSKGSKDYGSSS